MALKRFAYRQQQATAKAKQAGAEQLKQAMAHKTATGHSMNCLAQSGYARIADYEFFCDEAELAHKMQCHKQAQCSGQCCLQFLLDVRLGLQLRFQELNLVVQVPVVGGGLSRLF